MPCLEVPNIIRSLLMSQLSTAPAVAQFAQQAAVQMATASTKAKNGALAHMAELLERHCDEIVRENEKDLQAAREKGIAGPLYERLFFDAGKVHSRIQSLHKIAALPDPVGQISDQRKTDNGLMVGRMRVALGVLLMIYEARPHVTVNAGAFAIKSGNAVICKGGSEALRCNTLLGRLWADALRSVGLPDSAVQTPELSHDQVDELLQMPEAIALVIPRGGKNLIGSVTQKSKIPVIKHFEGVCHIYIDGQADIHKALQIVLDSKLLMPAVCNAAETVLIDQALVDRLPELLQILHDKGIRIRGCDQVCNKFAQAEPAGEADWACEYLDKIYAIRVVKDLDGALAHIAKYASGHTDVIVTENYSRAQRFLQTVDSSVVLVNASTMFCDGETLGMGAEIGISTDKFHARGPMGLAELTSYKHVILGQGQIMGQSWN